LPTTPNGAFTPVIPFNERITDVVATQDQVAKGHEFDLTYNPTSQWRISLNVAEQLTVNDNTGLQVRKMMDELQPVWAGTAGPLPLALTGTGDLGGDWTSINIDVRKNELLDGGPSPEQRRWRANLVTNYTFKGGKLDGVRIGGAYRWQDKSAIGYPIIVGPDGINGIIDVRNPYYGEAEKNIDLWVGYKRKLGKNILWNVQLNVKNVGEGDRLIAVSAQPNGMVDTPRIAQAQTWSLLNSFEF
jgi:outer membrane receptor for ferric coprogen and ferric-rhodotorulic acid